MEENEKSIRNRFNNSINGRFNKFGSSEINWNNFNEMIIQSIRNNEFSKEEIIRIKNEIPIEYITNEVEILVY